MPFLRKKKVAKNSKNSTFGGYALVFSVQTNDVAIARTPL